MIKSKVKNKAISFIMGTDSSIREKLDSMGVIYEIIDGDYLTKVPSGKLIEYETLISDNLKPGFWNQYIDEEVVFIFKTLENKILRYVWNEDTEKDILKLCNSYAEFNKESIQDMLLEVPFYKENSVIVD